MAIEIVPLVGQVEDPINGGTMDRDTGIDQVMVVNKLHPKPGIRIGYAARRPNAPLTLLMPCSEADVSEAENALRSRECEANSEAGKRKVTVAPPLATKE